MSDRRVSPPEVSSQTIGQYLAANAQHELDALRAELDVRLSALETALAHPDPRTSLADLVLNLARVATAEAEAATARAALEAQLHEQERAAAAASEAQRSLEAERGIVKALKLELEQARTALAAEHETAVGLRQEFDGVRKSLEEERLAAAEAVQELERAQATLHDALAEGDGPRRQVAELEEALQHERDRSAALDSELARQRDAVAQMSQAIAGLQRELAAAQRTGDTRAADDAAHRAEVDALEQRCAELDRQCATAIARASDAARERDASAAALDTARQEAAAAQAAVEMRVAAIDAERAKAERNWKAAEARADAASAERDKLTAALEAARQEAAGAQAALEMRAAAVDADRTKAAANWKAAEARAREVSVERDQLTAMLEAAKKSVQGMRDAVESRLAAIDAKRARTVKAWKEAEARAETAIRERDELVHELETVRQTTTPEGPIARELEAANERIRVLELLLLQRDKGPSEGEVDLASALETKASPPSEQAGQRATRYTFPPRTKVQLDGDLGVLVDLSVTGAQVICASSPEVGRVVILALLSDQTPCFCQGRLLWAKREPSSKGRLFKYRAGLVFTAIDEAAIQAFIKQHSVS